MTEAAFPSLVSKVSYDDYPSRQVANHKAAPASPIRGPAQQQSQQAAAVHGQVHMAQQGNHSATAAVHQQPPQQQKQAALTSTPPPPPPQQAAQLPDPRWSLSGNSPSQSPHKQPPPKPQALQSALPPGYMPQARPAGHVPQPRRVAQQPMTEQAAMTNGSELVSGMHRQRKGLRLLPGRQLTRYNHPRVSRLNENPKVMTPYIAFHVNGILI